MSRVIYSKYKGGKSPEVGDIIECVDKGGHPGTHVGSFYIAHKIAESSDNIISFDESDLYYNRAFPYRFKLICRKPNRGTKYLHYQSGESPAAGDEVLCVIESDYEDIARQSPVLSKMTVASVHGGSLKVDGKTEHFACTRFRLLSRATTAKQLVACRQCDRAGVLVPGRMYTIIARDDVEGVVKIEEHQNTWFASTCFGPNLATNVCPALPDSLDDFKSHYLKAMDYAKKLEADVAHWKRQYDEAADLIAKMHAAVVGYVGGPKRGVIEDVEDLRKERDELKKAIESSEYNRNNTLDANRGLRQQIISMKERFDRIRIEAQLG